MYGVFRSVILRLPKQNGHEPITVNMTEIVVNATTYYNRNQQNSIHGEKEGTIGVRTHEGQL